MGCSSQTEHMTISTLDQHIQAYVLVPVTTGATMALRGNIEQYHIGPVCAHSEI